MMCRVTAATRVAVTVWALLGFHDLASAQPASAGAPLASVSGFVRNWTRAESVRFFQPAGRGDPTYTDIANRLQFGVRRTTARYEILAALQYVQFGGLPRNASGPGPLGVGAVYFAHSGRTDSRQVYLRYLNVRLTALAPGLSVQAGRMGYTAGAEAPSGNPKIETVKRQRVDARLIGEFEWSLYQRGFDGVRVDVDRPTWHVSAAAFRPTQGGFEDAAGVEIDSIDVFAASLTLRPGRLLPHTDSQIFAYRYSDRRPVRARPDNTGRPADRVNVQVNSFGASLVGAYPQPNGDLDVMLWVAGQTGSWYGQSHRAYTVAAEIGHQWTRATWQPWIRIGALRASGDHDPSDDRHGTFFQLLPTARKYSLSAAYSLMNLTDVFAQALLFPRQDLNLRVDVHRVGLAQTADSWYAGSGASQESGTIFGFAGRPSQGVANLGTVLEGAASYTLTPYWSVNGYVGFINGGDVIDRTFADDRFTFAYVENVFRFQGDAR